MTVMDTADRITLDLHVDLYPRPAIDRAIASFAALGEFSVEITGQYHRVTVKSAAGAAALGREFTNHVLSLAVVGVSGDEPDVARAPGAVDAT